NVGLTPPGTDCQPWRNSIFMEQLSLTLFPASICRTASDVQKRRPFLASVQFNVGLLEYERWVFLVAGRQPNHSEMNTDATEIIVVSMLWMRDVIDLVII